jgi:maleate isomerase
MQNDNWGHRARIGMFIVGNEAVPESEWWAMLPANVSAHAARVTAKAPWAQWSEGRTDVELASDLSHGAEQFVAMRLSAVVIGHSSSSFMGGKGWDVAVISRLSGIIDSDVAITTNGLDTIAALRQTGVERPFLIMPPWFNDDIISAGIGYYRDHGFEPSGHLRYDPGPDWRHLPPEDLYPLGMGFAQEIEPLHAQIKEACPVTADGVLIAGTGFRCVGILSALEQDLKRPVLSANQASLWNCLKLSGIEAEITGYGQLLRM